MFTLVRCAACGLVYQWPQLDWAQLRPYYEHEYMPHVDPAQSVPSGLSQRLLPLGPFKQRRYIERFAQGGRLLDVGCGYGDFLEGLQRRGNWQLYGLEPTPDTAAATARRLKIPVIGQRFEDVALLPDSLDVITLWNVLEHVAEPMHVLSKAWEALKPGGHLILAIPNFESLSRRIFGRFWVGWDQPRHLYIYPRPVLKRMFAESGFQPVDRRCFMNSYTVFGLSLAFWMQSWPAQLQPVARQLQRAYATTVARALLYPVQLVIERLTIATVICWTARKVGPDQAVKRW